jgi:NitT/TauT family transport system permease protein
MPALARLRHILLPQLAPHLSAAARAGIALIWKIVLVVEFLGRSNGIGFRIHLDFQMFDIAGVLAHALAFVAIMLAVEWLLLAPLARRANRWRQP